jgi:uncharacterized glyoxalase superfamily protein PhnB
MKVNKVTPILVVDAIEPALPFWHGQLGFEKVVEVPHEGRLGFVLLARDGHEVMLQTRASIAADVAAVAALDPACAIYCDVDSLDAAIEAAKGAEVLVPRRTTFYGAEEIWVRDPTGAIVGFAEVRGG